MKGEKSLEKKETWQYFDFKLEKKPWPEFELPL